MADQLGFRIGGIGNVGFGSNTSSSSSSAPVIVSAQGPINNNMQDAQSIDEDKAETLSMKKISAAKRSAILSQLEDCMDCNNKAKRDCPHKRCKTCCARFIAMAAKVCDAHAMTRDESLVGRHLMGIVDGSFENGHFITCVIEDMTYKGIIFTNTCAVKVWRVPKPPDLHVTPSSALNSVSAEQVVQVSSPLGPAGSSSSAQPQPSALTSFVTTNPVVGLVPAASLGNNGKRRYVKSGRYAKRPKTSAEPGAYAAGPSTPSAQQGTGTSTEMYDRPMFDDEEDVMEEELRQGMPERLARQMAAYRRGFGSTASGKKSAKQRKGPRRPQTNYTFFVAEQRPIFMNSNPDASFKDIAGIVAQKWRSLTDEEKKPYNEKAAKDRVRFETEKAMMERSKEPLSMARGAATGSSSSAGDVPGDVVLIDNRAFRQPSLTSAQPAAHTHNSLR